MTDRAGHFAGLFDGFLDDAAMFPPSNLSLEESVAAHARHRASSYAALLGGFVVTDLQLADLLSGPWFADDSPLSPLVLSLVVTGGAGAIAPAATWAARSADVSLGSLAIALRDEDDLARNARRVVAAVDAARAEGVVAESTRIRVELPRCPDGPGHGWLAAADELSIAEFDLSLRTGGVEASAIPSSAELAACLEAALDREMRFVCTAGLHHAVRAQDPSDGLTHHGFLNVLAATEATLAGGDVSGALEETDPDTVRDALDAPIVRSSRRWCRSIGTCSITDPVHDLRALGLVEEADR